MKIRLCSFVYHKPVQSRNRVPRPAIYFQQELEHFQTEPSEEDSKSVFIFCTNMYAFCKKEHLRNIRVRVRVRTELEVNMTIFDYFHCCRSLGKENRKNISGYL